MQTITKRAAWLAAGLLIGLGLVACAEELPDPPPGPPDASTGAASLPPADPMTRAQQSLALVSRDRSGELVAATGVVLTADGQVLVVSPTLAEAPGEAVTVIIAAGEPQEATVQAADPRTGVVVVTVDPAPDPAPGLVPAVVGDSDAVDVGDAVTLMSALADGDPRLSPGEITATDQVISGIGLAMIEFSVEAGPTGDGPVVNQAGEVIGLMSASSANPEGGVTVFAIPSGVAARIADELIATGEVRHPYLGVSVDDAPGGGAVVQQVAAGSPAEAAGLRAGDVITRVGDRTVEVAADVAAEVLLHPVGDQLTIAYIRDGAQAETTATLAPAPAG